jgi:flap endonuclease-1
MGIKQLFQIIKEEAPDAIKEGEIKHQFGRKVAIVCHLVFLTEPSPADPAIGCFHEYL